MYKKYYFSFPNNLSKFVRQPLLKHLWMFQAEINRDKLITLTNFLSGVAATFLQDSFWLTCKGLIETIVSLMNDLGKELKIFRSSEA